MKSLKTAYLKIIFIIFFISFMLFGSNLSQLKITTNSDEIAWLIGFIICSTIIWYLILTILMKLSNPNIEILLSSIAIICSSIVFYLTSNIFICICVYAELIISIVVLCLAIYNKINPFKEVH